MKSFGRPFALPATVKEAVKNLPLPALTRVSHPTLPCRLFSKGRNKAPACLFRVPDCKKADLKALGPKIRLENVKFDGDDELKTSSCLFRVPDSMRAKSEAVRIQFNPEARIEYAVFDGEGSSGGLFSLGPLIAMGDSITQFFKGSDVSFLLTPTMLSGIKDGMGGDKLSNIKTGLLAIASECPVLQKKYENRDVLTNHAEGVYDIFLKKSPSIIEEYANPIPGFIDTMRMLRKNGIKKIILVTAYSDIEADAFLNGMRRGGAEFDHVVTSSRVKNSRPFSSLLHTVTDDLAIRDPSSMAVFGDSKYDMLYSASLFYAIGLPLYGTATGIVSLEQYKNMSKLKLRKCQLLAEEILIKHGAHYLVNHPMQPMYEQVKTIIKDINFRLSKGERPYTKPQDGIMLMEEFCKARGIRCK